MEKNDVKRNFDRNKRSIIVVVIFLLLLLVTVGYATITTQLKINGTTTIRKNSWNVYISKIANISTNGTASITSNPTVTAGSISTTSINYDVTLNQPGDYYEFEFTVTNGGTLDIILSKVPSLSGLSNSQATYVSHTIKNSDETDVTVNNSVIKSGQSKTYKIRVLYKSDIVASDLPSDNQSLSLSVQMDYIQH